MNLKQLLKNWVTREKRPRVNHHFIFVEAPVDIVAPEIIFWGESLWWPPKCLTRFERKDPNGEIIVGTEYRQKMRFPLAPVWKVRVTKLAPQAEIERTFLSGMLKGAHEAVSVEGRYNGTKVNYSLKYQVHGFLNKILWPLIFQRLHDKNIKMILAALNDYAVQKHRAMEAS